MATPSLTASSAPETRPTRVCLVHNYRERGQMSMKLYAENLGTALEHAGFEVNRLRVNDVLPRAWHKVKGFDKLDSYLGRFVALPHQARRREADLFHVVDHGQAFLLDDLDPARTVVTCHDVILLVLASGRLGSRFSPTVATNVFRHTVSKLRKTRWIIADSEQSKRDLCDLVDINPENVTVIFPGLNAPFRHAPELRDEVRKQHNLGDGPLLLQVGQTGFYKNVEGCIRVVAHLRANGVPAKLVRSGQKLRAEQLALAARLGVANAVHDLGPCSDTELIRRYNAADLLLFPSLYEGFGWPPLEAMACGLPVVCSRAGSLPEVIGDAALTSEPEDVTGLARHVVSILESPQLQQTLRERGLARAKLFSWERTAQQVGEYYHRVLES